MGEDFDNRVEEEENESTHEFTSDKWTRVTILQHGNVTKEDAEVL